MSERVALYRRLPLTTADRWWIDRARRSADGRVLELGAGTGRLTVALAAAGLEVTAVERDPAMVAALRAHLRSRRVAATVVEADVTQLPALGTFGAVLAPTSLLNEVPDGRARQSLLERAARACAPEGEVALHLLGPWWLARVDGTVAGRLEPEEPDGGDGRSEPGSAVDVELDFAALDHSGRRQATLTYRFADGTVAHDHLDAAVVTPGELEARCAHAGLVVDAASGQPSPHAPAWHVVARPGPR